MTEEYKLQIAALKHIATAFPQVKVIHIPNQARDATEAYFNKQMGVVPGASDLLFGWKGRNVGVIELKASDGRLSNEQNRFLSWADSVGWSTGVAKSVKSVHLILKSWGLVPAHEAIKEPDLRTKEKKFLDIHNMYKP